MKIAGVTLLFASLAFANPAPAAQPAAAAVPAPVAQPEAQPVPLNEALIARIAEPAPEVVARAGKKPKSSSNNGNSTTDAAGMLTPSRALQLGALGVGVIEVVRLWG